MRLLYLIMKKYLIILFILGIIFRLWIANLVPQPFVFDQTEYHSFALQMLDKGLVSWQPRLYGYPLFLSLIYRLFGEGNFLAVFVVQSIVDTLTGLIIYLIAKKIFKNQIVAIFSFTLYLFNPFTSVYAVLTLSEVWGIFLMAVIIYLLIEFAEVGHDFFPHLPKSLHFVPQNGTRGAQGGGRAQKAWSPRKLFLLAFLLGYLPQVRPAFLFYSLTLLGIIVIWIYKSYIQIPSPGRSPSGHLPGVLIAILLFILPFTYNAMGNWVYFRQFSPMTVDNLFVREFYISLYVSGRSPFQAATPDVFPPEVQKIYNEYTPVPQNTYARKAMAQKYFRLGLQKVAENPLDFIFSRIKKFWYVWEKHFIFYYTQPANALVDFLTYWGNNLLIFLAVFGFYFWFRKEAKEKMRWFGFFTIFTVFYISLIHSFSLTEERYSFPGYPLIFLFAGYGLRQLFLQAFMINLRVYRHFLY